MIIRIIAFALKLLPLYYCNIVVVIFVNVFVNNRKYNYVTVMCLMLNIETMRRAIYFCRNSK